MEAGKLIDVCALSELIVDQIRVVRLADRPAVGVVRHDGRLHAFSLMCPHRGGPLDRGTIRPSVASDGPGERRLDSSRPVLACPWHNWEYCLLTGKALFDPRRMIQIYGVDVVDDRVKLRLKD